MLVKTVPKKEKIYAVDFTSAGLTAICLSPYHDVINSIELVWGDIKRRVSITLNSFTSSSSQNFPLKSRINAVNTCTKLRKITERKTESLINLWTVWLCIFEQGEYSSDSERTGQWLNAQQVREKLCIIHYCLLKINNK